MNTGNAPGFPNSARINELREVPNIPAEIPSFASLGGSNLLPPSTVIYS